MEHNLKILTVEYLSNQLLDPNHIFNSSLDDQTIMYKSFKLKRPPMEDDLKISTEWIVTYGVLGEIIGKNTTKNY